MFGFHHFRTYTDPAEIIIELLRKSVYTGDMRIDIHIHHHLDGKLTQAMEKIMADLSKLQAEVTAISNTDDAILALIDGLVTELKNAGSDQAAIDQVVSDLEAKRTALAAAVTSNTPAPATAAPAADAGQATAG